MLVSKDEYNGVVHISLTEETVELLLGLLDTITIIGVDNINQTCMIDIGGSVGMKETEAEVQKRRRTVGALVIVAPQWSDLQKIG